jgi:hypothetical protein
VTFVHSTPNRATRGTIAGVLSTVELIESLRKIAGRISPVLCSGSAFDSIAQQIAQASDMFVDGSNAPGVTCDAISIGVGFDADEVTNVTQVQPDPPPSPNPCP